ncbi:MAG TPA: glycosyltransferase family 39 protein [Solirubrobacterales bacterium]|nr:glycosyltransferase family 39 protein [Solirubrobacterales bacterium]
MAIAADDGYRPHNDAFEYDYTARSIAAGEGYPPSGYLLQGGPTAVRGPGYPYLLGTTYALSDDSRTAGRLLGAALGVVVVLLLYLLARRIWGRRVGLVAAGLAAVFPPLVLLSRDLVSETLFIALELGALLCVLNFRRAGGALRWAAAAGALCGLAALTRNTALALMLPVALGVWTARPALRLASLAAPGLALICAALVVLPWIVRDANEFGRFVPITTSGGIALSGTYNETSEADPDAHGAWRNPQVVPGLTALFTTPGRDEAEVDAELRERAIDFAGSNPAYVAEVTAWNLLRLFEIRGGSVVDARGEVVSERGIGSATPAAERIGLGIVAILALLGGVAIARSRPRGPDGPPRIPHGPLFLWLVPILMILVAAPIAGLPRYRLPADPFLLILAAIGATATWDWLRSRRSGPEAVA